MAKEHEQVRITPENAEELMDSYLEKIKVGSVEFIAFCAAFEARRAFVDLLELKRLQEYFEDKKTIPEKYDHYQSGADLDSALRRAEVRNELADLDVIRNDSMIPGHYNAAFYAERLIWGYEDKMIKTEHFDIDDPKLEEIRRRSQAHELISSSLGEKKSKDERQTGHWLIALLKNIK